MELAAKKVKAGRPDLLHAIGRVLFTDLPAGTPHAVAAVVPHLTGNDAAALNHSNRARTLDDAFGGKGVNDCTTDFGILRRSKGAGTKGWMLSLRLAPQSPQPVDEEHASN